MCSAQRRLGDNHPLDLAYWHRVASSVFVLVELEKIVLGWFGTPRKICLKNP